MLRIQLSVWQRLSVMVVVVILGVSACYKNAGDNVEPTSNRVDLSDIEPTTAAPPSPLPSPTPTTEVGPTATRTLVPTITPFDQPESAAPTEIEAPAPTNTPIPTTVPDEPAAEPATPTVQMPPSFTPAITAEEPAEAVITTPGMSDIPASVTPRPTTDPALMPTPTSIPVEENECIHLVQSGDTLYSIAQDNAVLLADLVAANPDYLGGSPNTPLQLGWELRIPGCETLPPTTETAAPAEATTQPVLPGTETTHTVQAGEHLYAIARQYGVDPQAIIQANNLTNPDQLQPGDVLIIPAVP